MNSWVFMLWIYGLNSITFLIATDSQINVNGITSLIATDYSLFIIILDGVYEIASQCSQINGIGLRF